MTPPTLTTLDTSRKVLVTGILLVASTGFGLGHLNIFLSYEMADGRPGLTPADLEATFALPRFAVMVRGPMAVNAGPYAETLADWALRGGPKAEYDAVVRPILAERNCARCHNGFEQRSLASHAEIEPLLERGLPVKRLGDLSHAHVFGIGLILTAVSAVFTLSGARPRVKTGLIGAVFAALLADVGSWWAAKFLAPAFVYAILAAGAVTAAGVAVMVVYSFVDLWFPRCRTG